MKTCYPNVGKSFLDIYAFLDKTLAAHPETIRNLELELYRMDEDFNLSILTEEQWVFPKDPPVFSHPFEHTILVQKDFYISAVKNHSADRVYLVQEYLHYFFLSPEFKSLK